MTVYKIPVNPADERAKSYGITHASLMVYRVENAVNASGPSRGRVHNRHHPHRVQVWDNAGRPNTAPDKWNEYTGKPGPGRWLDPSGRGTDDETTVIMSAESICIDDSGTGTGTVGSGQVYADETLRIGDTLTLLFVSDAPTPVEEWRQVSYVLTSRPLADPELVPLAGVPTGAFTVAGP